MLASNDGTWFHIASAKSGAISAALECTGLWNEPVTEDLALVSLTVTVIGIEMRNEVVDGLSMTASLRIVMDFSPTGSKWNASSWLTLSGNYDYFQAYNL